MTSARTAPAVGEGSVAVMSERLAARTGVEGAARMSAVAVNAEIGGSARLLATSERLGARLHIIREAHPQGLTGSVWSQHHFPVGSPLKMLWRENGATHPQVVVI